MKTKKASTRKTVALLKSRFSFGRRQKTGTRRSQSNRLNYETLENRLVLTTFIVTTAADTNGVVDGFVSLREAIFAARTNAAFGDAPAGEANGDVIRFDPSIYNSTIFLTLGQINISDDLLIQGGDSNITISGLGQNRLFQIVTSDRVGFSKLTFVNGNAATGGAMNILGTGTTLLVDTTFTNNVATGDGGGAVYYERGNLFVTNSTFNGNQANGSMSSGGAIYQASGNIYVNGGLMDANLARRSGGAIEAHGGTFFSIGLTVGTALGGNSVIPQGTEIFSDGGGIHVTGHSRTTIQGGQFVGNFAARSGGAMWVGSDGQLFVRPGTNITNNQAAGAILGQGGGGIFSQGGRLYVNQANISSNSATGVSGSGGGIYAHLGNSKTVLSNATVSGNAARRTGGGIHVDDGMLQLTNSSVTNNDVGTTFASNLAHGGGIYAGGFSTVVVNNGQVANNSAIMRGGGIFGGANSLVFVRNFASVSFNTLSGAGSLGGGIYINGKLVAKDAVFQRNVATTSGGGLYLSGSLNARIDNTNFFENNGGTRGGGIFNDSSMYITNTTFAGNVVSVDGGGYFSTANSTTLAMGLDFVGNIPNNTN